MALKNFFIRQRRPMLRKKSLLIIFLVGILSLGITLSVSAETIKLSGRFPKLFDSQKITAGSSATSESVYIGDAEGNFSVQYNLSGSGDLKIQYLLSLDGTSYLTPSSASSISSNVTSSSSPDIISFSPELAENIKIKVTETSSSDNVTSFNLWLGRQ